jgi:hypothetical protein
MRQPNIAQPDDDALQTLISCIYANKGLRASLHNSTLYHCYQHIPLIKLLIQAVIKISNQSLRIYITSDNNFPTMQALKHHAKGMYDGAHTIYIRYTDDEKALAATLVHELSHFIIHHGNLKKKLERSLNLEKLKREIECFQQKADITTSKKYHLLAWQLLNIELLKALYPADHIKEEIICRSAQATVCYAQTSIASLLAEYIPSLKSLLDRYARQLTQIANPPRMLSCLMRR